MNFDEMRDDRFLSFTMYEINFDEMRKAAALKMMMVMLTTDSDRVAVLAAEEEGRGS